MLDVDAAANVKKIVSLILKKLTIMSELYTLIVQLSYIYNLPLIVKKNQDAQILVFPLYSNKFF